MRLPQYVALASFLVVAPVVAQRPAMPASRVTMQVGEQTIPLIAFEGSQLQQWQLVEDKLGTDQVSQRGSTHLQPITIRVAREYESILSAWWREAIAAGPVKAARTVKFSVYEDAGRVAKVCTLTRAWPRMVAETAASEPGAQRVISAELVYERMVSQTL